MSRKNRYAVWLTVFIIDFLLLNAGLDGWFTGFAYGSFESNLKELLLVNYFESLIIPIVLTLAAYTLLNASDSNRTPIEHVKRNVTAYLLAFIVLFQLLVFTSTGSQIKTITAEVQSVRSSIWGSRSSPRFFGYGSSIMSQLSDIDYKLEEISSNIDDLQTEVQYLQR